MKYSTFNELVEKQFKMLRDLLAVKGGEYSPDIDRLYSFKAAARLQDKTPIQALGGMLSKHTVSIYDMIAENSHDLAKYDEKINDSIAYLLLLKALVVEELEYEKHRN
jgi:hypothetical protein